ncbi:hypothetical protein [Microbulbifer rhizosphaerae]|uniref:Uncharacterized protein n=1 Tax=Microbulbifer rhizosphaerae TaxID=1562603 RepID=A0A7W4WFB2_9GAMM|nr:hypothetical protein [Microbulbifer rhizosphaerae]MBB3063184.1 hypothetical protein [Microbulbifer rhizosphaerae]
MNLFQQTGFFFTWFNKVFGSFWQVRPGISLVVIFAAVVARICRLLAFVLPLKVILLASSEGVPRYFRHLIDPADKMGWIIGLSIAAFAFYALVLVLDALSERLAALGGSEAMSEANEINIIVGQEDRVKSYYAICCRIWSNTLFAMIGLSALALLNVSLFVTLLALIAAEYLLSAWVVKGLDKIVISGFAKFVRDGLGRYLNILITINFLIGFLVILMPFVVLGGSNVLIAIISIIAIRHILNALSSIVSDCVRLVMAKDRIDPLVFRHVQVRNKEIRDFVSLKRLLCKGFREQWISRRISSFVSDSESITIKWLDPSVRDISIFSVRTSEKFTNGSDCLQLQVFGSRWRHFLANERFLFDKVARSDLLAPELIATFEEEGFPCQMLDFGKGVDIPKSKWKAADHLILQKHWSCAPPKNLVIAYTASHPLLHQRVTVDLVKRIELAADSCVEIELLAKFIEELPRIRKIVKNLPMYIHNPDFQPANVVMSSEKEGYLVMNWGRWTLEPIGVKLPTKVNDEDVIQMLQNIKQARSDIPGEFGIEHIRLASQVSQLENLIIRQKYKAALKNISTILKSPVINEEYSLAETA